MRRMKRIVKGVVYVLAYAVADLAERVVEMVAEPSDGNWLTAASNARCSTCLRTITER